jgi:hypothetical protein
MLSFVCFIVEEDNSNSVICACCTQDFGYKWMKEKEDERRKKKIERQQERQMDKKCSLPPAKRIKCESAQEKDDAAGLTSKDATETEASSEGCQMVPGMNGLSVDFVRDTFYNNAESDFDEGICSDRLPRGR